MNVPDVKDIADKRKRLERRRKHLLARIEKRPEAESSGFDRAEASALAAALDCMRYVESLQAGAR